MAKAKVIVAPAKSRGQDTLSLFRNAASVKAITVSGSAIRTLDRITLGNGRDAASEIGAPDAIKNAPIGQDAILDFAILSPAIQAQRRVA